MSARKFRFNWEAWSNFTLRRSKAILAGVGLMTLFFALGLLRLDFDTRIHDFHQIESKQLIETIERDFAEGNYLLLIFESRGERSLLEPELLKQQFRVLEAIKRDYKVTTLSLVDAVNEGLQRVKKKSLLEVEEYTPIAEGLMALSGGRTVRELEKVVRHLLSDPEAVAYYSKLRIAAGFLGGVAGPSAGSVETTYKTPMLKSIKALVQLSPDYSRKENKRALAEIRDLAKGMETPDLQVHALADDLIAAEIDSRTLQNLALMAAIVLGADGLIFWLMFRRKREILIPMVLMLASLVWTFGAAGWLGIRLSFLHLLVIPILFGTADDDAFVFGMRLNEERPGASSLHDALRKTFRFTGKAIFLTTFTTFISFFFGAFPLTSLGIFNFNIVISIAMLMAFALTVLLQGPLRQVLGDSVAPIQVEVGVLNRRLFAAMESLSCALGRLSLWFMDLGSWRISTLTGILVLAGVFFAIKVPLEFDRRIFLRPSMQTFAADRANDRYFGRSDHGYILFEGPIAQTAFLEKIPELLKALKDYPELEKILGEANTDSITELMAAFGARPRTDAEVTAAFDRMRESERTANYPRNQSFREAFRHLVHVDQGYDSTLVKFFIKGGEGKKVREFLGRLQSKIAALGFAQVPGLQYRIGGGDISYHIGEGYYFKNFLQSFLLSLVFNFLVLWLLWRSLRQSLLALVPIFVSLALTLAAMALLDIPLNVLNICIGSIVVGVGVDYSIHILERFEEECIAYPGDPRLAMQRVLKTLGPSILGGAFTTIVGFAACSVLAMPVATSFGWLMGFAILVAFLASSLLLPGLTLLRLKRG